MIDNGSFVYIRDIDIKAKDPPWFAVQMGSVAESVAAKVKHLFGLFKEFEKKSVEMEAIFNRCWVLEIQNAAFTNQSWASTHQGSWGQVHWFTL